MVFHQWYYNNNSTALEAGAETRTQTHSLDLCSSDRHMSQQIKHEDHMGSNGFDIIFLI